MNSLVIYILGLQIFLCFIIAFLGIFWFVDNNDEEEATHHYLYITENAGTNFLLNFFRFFILLNTLIPISLIVTIEIVKVCQARLISFDANMFSVERNRPAKVASSSLIEELGQINYIFSDKTGTLTQNIMEFKLCYIGTELYGDQTILQQKK